MDKNKISQSFYASIILLLVTIGGGLRIFLPSPPPPYAKHLLIRRWQKYSSINL